MFAIIICVCSILCSNSNQTELNHPSDKHVNEFLNSKGFTNLKENFYKEMLDHFIVNFSILYKIQCIEQRIIENKMEMKQIEQEYVNIKKASNEFTASNTAMYNVFMFQFRNKDAKTKTIIDENGKEKLVFDDESNSEPMVGSTANPSLTINRNQKKPIPKYNAEQIITGLNMCKKKQLEHNRFMERVNQDMTQKANLLQEAINNYIDLIAINKKQNIGNYTAIYNKLHTLNQKLDKDETVIDLYKFFWDIQKVSDISRFIVGNETIFFV